MGQLQAEIFEEKRVRVESLGSLDGEIKELEDELGEQLETEKARQEEGDRELVMRLEEESSKYRRELLDNRESRETHETEVYELMKNVVVKMKDEIQLERTARESNQESLLNLLEETCQKIEVMASQS